jgi:chorismate dehydratase
VAITSDINPILKAGIPDHIDTLTLTTELKKPPYNQRIGLFEGAFPEIARLLSLRELDIGLITSIDYSIIRAHRGIYILPGVAVSSKNLLKSVMLIFNRGLERINRIAALNNSIEYLPLLQIILKEKYDIKTEIEVHTTDENSLLHLYDAVLISGIEALRKFDNYDNHLDLSEEWYDLTDGLPFVFAFWAAGRGRMNTSDITLFRNARIDGEKNIMDTVETYLRNHQAEQSDRQILVNHLTQSLYYDLRPADMEGIKEYYTYCYYYGLIQEIPELHFLEESPNL